ncbi:MAG: hypothetical protein IKS45_10575 [Thermoguttaceae bacterium]|nr:hypothetical protein [Thermoguttaceae bacterium]
MAPVSGAFADTRLIFFAANPLSGSRIKSAEGILSRKEHKVRKEIIGVTFAAEASKNLESAESPSDLLDRGCISRRSNFKHKEHKEHKESTSDNNPFYPP